jgi:hypothetical protein
MSEAAPADIGFDQGQVESDVKAAQKDTEHAARDAKRAVRDAAAAGRDAHTADVDTKDLDAQLAAARARLKEAAHEVAALSAQMSRPFMEQFMVFGEGPPRAVIGVQLDPEAARRALA